MIGPTYPIASLTPILDVSHNNHDVSEFTNPKQTVKHQRNYFLKLPAMPLILLSCVFVLFLQPCISTSIPDFGPLYDCTRVHETILYKFESHVNCTHKMHLSKAQVHYFQGTVHISPPKHRQFYPIIVTSELT